MTLKIRELIIRAEISDSPSGTGERDSLETIPDEMQKNGPESMADRFFNEDRTLDNER
jgi:hypothetical protein